MNRKEIKKQAKKKIMDNFWPAIIVSLLTMGISVIIELTTRSTDAKWTGLIIGILLGTLMSIFSMKFFMINSKIQAKFTDAYDGINWSTFWGFLGLNILVSIKVFLWSLLLIVPGIVKMQEYIFVPYIYLDDPRKSYSECFEESRQMTYGSKTDIFVLQLSFFGWAILTALSFGIISPFVNAYIAQTLADTYFKFRN